MNLTPVDEEDKWKNFGLQSPLISTFQNFHKLNEAIESIINAQTFPVRFAKHKHIASPLKRNRYIFLIIKGAAHGPED